MPLHGKGIAPNGALHRAGPIQRCVFHLQRGPKRAVAGHADADAVAHPAQDLARGGDIAGAVFHFHRLQAELALHRAGHPPDGGTGVKAAQLPSRDRPVNGAHHGPFVPHHQKHRAGGEVGLEVIQTLDRPARGDIAKPQVAADKPRQDAGQHAGMFNAMAEGWQRLCPVQRAFVVDAIFLHAMTRQPLIPSGVRANPALALGV